jgi:hypothetical protein
MAETINEAANTPTGRLRLRRTWQGRHAGVYNGREAVHFTLTRLSVTMNSLLDTLSEQEKKLHGKAVNAIGTMEQKEYQIRKMGVFDNYKRLHQEYLTLFDQTNEPIVRLEALKRLVFINWYSLVEPACLTGINELDEQTVNASFQRLNSYLIQGKLDYEFDYMLSYYSCWDWAILMYAEPELPELTAFVKSVDATTTIFHFKQHQSALMSNRGQMGIYWQSHGIGRQ